MIAALTITEIDTGVLMFRKKQPWELKGKEEKNVRLEIEAAQQLDEETHKSKAIRAERLSVLDDVEQGALPNIGADKVMLLAEDRVNQKLRLKNDSTCQGALEEHKQSLQDNLEFEPNGIVPIR